MVLDRYVNKMSNERFYYCFTKLALVKKGYPGRTAGEMMNKTQIMKRAGENPEIFYHYPPEKWADIVESNYISDFANKQMAMYVNMNTKYKKSPFCFRQDCDFYYIMFTGFLW